MKIGGASSIQVSEAWVLQGIYGRRAVAACDLHGGFAMRLAFQEQPRLDCPPVDAVPLNLNCRDEIIPILRGLQHVYGKVSLRRELLELVGNDVNADSSPDQGRTGLDYWTITVLAAVRLGCNFDYDKLQNLAEEHRTLRLMMGIGDWEDQTDFDWRRIRDNLCLLQPKTIEKINHLVVGAGHKLVPEAIEAVRGDTFVVETNVHYPTESSLIQDGLRKVATLAADLATASGQAGWRQHEYLLRNVKKIVRQISRVSRAKSQGADRLKPGYEKLLALAKDLLQRARQLLATLAFRTEGAGIDWLGAGLAGPREELWHYLQLTEKVCGTARRRVLLGETVPNEEKIFSIFEPHTELIKRGKQPNPIQYGHKVLLIEDAVGFICHYGVVDNNVLDQDVMVPAMRKLQKRVAGKIKRASFDRAFHTPENQEQLATIVAHPCIPKKGQILGRKQQEEGTVEFRQGRQNHPGIESAIGAVQTGNGQERCRDKSKLGYERYVGLGVLGRNLQVLGKLLLAQDDAKCAAAKSKRKAAG
jgi:transposase, IS5 family